MQPKHIVIYALAAIVPPLIVGSLSAVKISSDIMLHKEPEPIESPRELSPPSLNPQRPTALVLAGTQGTQTLELLGAYGILSQSGLFNTLIVAPEEKLLPTTSALGIVPHTSIEKAPKAEILVIPSLLENWDDTLRSALRARIEQVKWVVALGEGSRILAELSLLKEGTSHVLSLDAFEKNFPEVKWDHHLRVVESGKFITSGGGFAALEASLDLVEKYSPGSTRNHWRRSLHAPESSPREGLSGSQIFGLLMRAAFDWIRGDISVWITDGVDELSLGLLLDLPPRTFSERVITVSEQRTRIQTRGGAWVVPTLSATSAPILSEVIESPGSEPPQASLSKLWMEAHDEARSWRWSEFSSDILLSRLVSLVSERVGTDGANAMLTQVEYGGAKPEASVLTQELAGLLLRALLLSALGVLLVRWYLRRKR